MENFFKKRWNKHYHKDNKNRYWHLTIDGLLSVFILALIIINAYLSTGNYGAVLGIDSNANNQNSNQNINTDTNTDNQVEENEPVIIKSTDIKLQSLARYYTAEGEQLGLGPLPPKIGAITKYWIFISLDEFTHDLKNVLVSAQLPENVSLTGKSIVTHGENMYFNNNSRQINWALDRLLLTDANQPIGLAFEVALTPSANQAGSVAELLNGIKVTALDSISQKIIIKTNTGITTNLINDKIANSDGIVVIK
ncbi:MAG: hypothetical protein Q7K65_00700 [Candidatus Buchananbacteria bacterium]|nr:hypothetical protein [Candidatus Buchananbacteria bacterium]